MYNRHEKSAVETPAPGQALPGGGAGMGLHEDGPQQRLGVARLQEDLHRRGAGRRLSLDRPNR